MLRRGGMGGTKSDSTLDRGSTIYGGLAGTYLGQRLLSVARGAPGFSRTRHYVIKDDWSPSSGRVRGTWRRCRKESRNTRTFPIIIFRDFAVGRRRRRLETPSEEDHLATAWGWIGGDSAARSRTFDNGAGSTFRPERRRNFRGWCALYIRSVDTSWPFVHAPCTTCTRILFHSE